MTDDLKLNLNREKPREKGKGITVILLVVLVILSVLNLVFVFWPPAASNRSGSALSPEKTEELALKLERQQLYGAAAAAWREYLESARLSAGERAGVWYRTGRLYQDSGNYEMALDAYYRSESIEPVREIQRDISLGVSECLKRLGRFAALRSELETRTAVDSEAPANGAETIAEIGNWKIDRSQLEKMIEAEIEAQLSSVAGSLPPDQLKSQKEKYLEEILGQGKLDQWLEQFIAEELLYRKAMEEKIFESPDYVNLAENLERRLLAQKYLEKEYAASVSVTEEEMRAWYRSNNEKFAGEDGPRPYEEVSSQVYAALKAEKEKRVQSELISKLKDEYDVVIHRSKLGGGQDTEK